MPKFLEEGSLVLQYYPAFQGVLGYRVLGQSNKGFSYWAYGPIPQSFVDSSGTSHEVGVIPELYTNSTAFELPNPLPGLASIGQLAADLFYHIDPGVLHHIFIDYNNALLRFYPQVPFGVTAVQLYGTTETPPTGIGFSSGMMEFLLQPDITVGWYATNLTNRNLRTNITMNLAEYQVAIITDPNLLYQMVTRSGDGRYTKFINVGGPQWTTNRTMFSVIGFKNPVPVTEILASRGTAVGKYFTGEQSGATYE